MRRIETREEIERKGRRNKILIGVVLAGIMLLSTAGYSLMSGDKTNGSAEKVNYNGIDFLKNGDLWTANVQGNPVYFSYLPNETRQVSVAKTLSDYSGKPLYFTGNGLAEQEITRNLGSFVSRMQRACFQDENCTGNLPIKNCSSNIIIIREQDIGSNIIRAEENCIYIISNDTMRDADAFMYKIFGIN